METNINEGIENQLSKTVTEADSAANCGSGLLPVFATPALVAFMEQTAHTSIEKMLPEGCTTVGSLINTTHIKPSKLGAKVKATAVLKEIDGRKLTFKVTAEDDSGIIGEGEHVRYIVDIERFMSKLK